MIERFSPRNQAAWHKLRAKDITASVAGALIGAHEFTTRYKLWALKTGKVFDDPEESPAIKRGRLLEPVAVQLLQELRPTWTIEHNSGRGVVYLREPEFRLGATPDVFAIDPERGPGVVQIKSVEKSAYRRKWLADGELPEPPLWIAVQAIIEAYLSGASWAAVAPLVVGYGIDLPIIDIPLIPGVVDRIKEESLEFWRMVESGEEPVADYALDAETIDAVYALDHGEEIDLSQNDRIHELLPIRKTAHDAVAKFQAYADEADAEIKALMKGASLAYLRGGQRITWKAVRKFGADGRATSFRVLRVPQPE